jgi:hypothetical protein
MMRPVPFFGAVFATAALALAQSGSAGTTDLDRLQRELLENRSEVERLIELRLRHGLGQPLETGGVVSSKAVTSESMEQLVREQREQEARASALREQHDKLRAAAEQRRAAALLQPDCEGCELELFDAPVAAAAPQQPAVLPALAPAGPVAAPRPEPQRAQVRGTSDPQRVARALCKVGQTLMDRATVAREQGNDALARDLDMQAAERLQLALDELAPLVKREEPGFAALFTQGQCRELLFRFSERYEGLSLAGSTRDYQRREQEVREPFLAIAARDVVRTGARQEVELLGPWGMAAQSALEHFRWLNLHGGYSRRAAIEALTWPGERDQ